MAIYRTGQASMDAQGYITGYGTKWREQLTLIRAGATIMFLTNPVRVGVITEVVSDTSIRAITTGGAVVSRTDYVILLHDSLTVDGLAQDVAETLRYYQGKETEFAHFIEFLETFDFAKLENLTNQTKDAAAKAKTSETNAKASENAALASKNAAKTSETNAKASETAANNSKNDAKTSETNAKTSETNAASSKTAAANSATAAKASQDAAKVSETNAANSKTAAANSASAAKTSETNAENSKTAAASSASAAKTSETNANNSKNAAKTSETNAKTSETNAKNSENKAKEYADQALRIASPLTQYDWPVITGNENVYIKIAKLTDPGNNNSHLTLMVTNGGNFGSTHGNIDFIEISARGMTNMTTSNVADFLSIRRLGSPSLDDTNQMRYGLVKGGGFIEVWAFQRAFINGVKVAILAQTGRTELYIPTGFVKQAAMPSGYVESSPRRIYDQGNKPSKGDVGLGNVTNDAQVKKVGDTMSGDLEITKGNASLHLKSTGGTSNVWFKNGDGSERGVIWATPNTESSGEVRIRAKNTAGVTGGEFIFDSAGKMTANGIQVNGKVSSRTVEVNNPDTNTAATSVKVIGKQHTPIVLERAGSNSNLSIGFKLDGKNLKRLGVDVDGDLSYGEAENQAANSKVVTLAMLNKDQTLGGAYIFSKLVTFNAGFAGTWEAVNITDTKTDLNGLVIKKDDVGAVRYYQCISQAGGANISNKPSGVSGNFLLRVESIRKVGQTDYTNKQTLISSDTSREYVRYVNNGTFSPWREVLVSGQNQDASVKTLSATAISSTGAVTAGSLSVSGNASAGGTATITGNVSVGGGSLSAITSQDKGVIMGRGSMVRDTSDGRLVLSSSGGAEKKLSLRPAGANASNNGVEISCTDASAGDTKIAFGQGAAIRCGASGSPIISAKAGQMMYFRPNGDTAAEGQVTIAGNGNMVVDGVVESKGLTARSGQITTNDGGIELYHASPYVDFHFNKSSADYTARIINDAADQLTFDCRSVRTLNDFTARGLIRGCYNDAFIAWPVEDPTGGDGAILKAPSFISRFNAKGGGARCAMWMEENVGYEHRGVIEVSGFGWTTQYWQFKANGKISSTTHGDVVFAGLSDINYKDNVVAYDGLQSLKNIKSMNLVKFTYKDDDQKRERRGVIAQQVREIDPCYVKETDVSYQDADGNVVENKRLVLDTNPLLMDALCAIKALSAQVEELKEEIRKLKGE